MITEIINPTTYCLLLSVTTWYYYLVLPATICDDQDEQSHIWSQLSLLSTPMTSLELTKDQAKSFQSYCLCGCSKGSSIDDIAGVHHTVKELFDNNLNHLERAGFLQKARFVTTIFSLSND